VLQTVCHRFNIYASSWVALALWRGDGHRKLVNTVSIMKGLVNSTLCTFVDRHPVA